MAETPAGRFLFGFAQAVNRAGALTVALLLDRGQSQGPTWTRTAAGFGLNPDLSPISINVGELRIDPEIGERAAATVRGALLAQQRSKG